MRLVFGHSTLKIVCHTDVQDFAAFVRHHVDEVSIHECKDTTFVLGRDPSTRTAPFIVLSHAEWLVLARDDNLEQLFYSIGFLPLVG